MNDGFLLTQHTTYPFLLLHPQKLKLTANNQERKIKEQRKKKEVMINSYHSADDVCHITQQ